MSSTRHHHDDHHRKRRRKESPERRSKSSRSFKQVDFDRFRSKLIKIFFGDEDIIQFGTDEYRDFWQFLHKYQAVERKRWMETGQRPRKDRKSLGFKLKPSSVLDLLNRIPYQDRDDRESLLTEDAVEEFQYILSQYVGFLQREKFAKLKKLRENQANLPIAEYRQEILERLRHNQIVIVAGDTGCGKSTQIPQYLLQAGYKNIACTQPRRIACISLAKRVGYETLNEYGSEIGYQIRFEKQRSDRTRVLFLTEGLLLRQVASDPSLSAYDVIVLDEIHERHLHGDFLLGIVKCLAQQRPELKVVLMSATINIKLFQDYFNDDAPVVQVPGRLYPIKLQYHPIPAIEMSATKKLNPAPYVRILQLIDRKYPSTERGDVLIFLSGIKEITIVADACKEYAERENKWIVLQLHSTLSLSEQDKVFDYPPEGVRKCIVSSNIAETSITIDGVRFVVDSGKVKEMQHDPVCKMQRLKEFWISQASAEQRKGRSGRTGPGVCFRLYSESEFKALAPFSTPEIKRVPLDNLILQMISMGLPDARKFPFLEAPPGESIENSIAVLKEQSALNDDETLTIMGKVLSNLPVDVTIGKMLIMGTLFHQIESVLSLAAALSVQSPFTNQAYKDSDCIAARRNLDSDHGDPITLLNSYREWLQIKSEDREPSRKWCKKRGLEEQRFYEMTKLRAQFKDLLEQAGLMKKPEVNAKMLSSSERALRHGELKQLHSMRREAMKKAGPRKKKVLKMKTVDDLEEAEANEEVDLKDIEFRLRNDPKKVRELLQGSKAYTYKDLNFLKIILTSGLYPQLAIPDEFNHAKTGSELLFHSRNKPFNFLHPNSIFAASPDYLALESTDIVSVPGFPAKYPVSSKHQILTYLSILETSDTTKAYLMNTLRMPALQSLLLFSHAIDTNGACTRIVCDSWVELRFPKPETVQEMLWRACRLRKYWQQLLNIRLQETLDDNSDQSDAEREDEAVLERKLSNGIIEFIHSETQFAMKRLLPGDLKVLHLGPGQGYVKIEVNPFVQEPEFQPTPHKTKGGTCLNPWLTYNCLENSGEDFQHLSGDWTCPICESWVSSEPLTRMDHYSKCLTQGEDQVIRDAIKDEEPKNPLAQEYFCQECDKKLFLTSIEILKHKKSHQ